jgi:two-component system response regulator PilR (NtrC family)
VALILIVDDESGIREMLGAVLEADGHRVRSVDSARRGLEELSTGWFDLIVTDLSMPGMNGVEMLERISSTGAEIPSIVITAYGSKETAIEAMRLGAVNYVEKPFDVEEMKIHVRRALEQRQMAEENRQLRARLSVSAELIGSSPAIQRVRGMIERVGPIDSTVLVTGESGVGKEVVARAIHLTSPRSAAAFVGVNCGAIPPELLESELFGHVKGAFTGADQNHRGLIERAHGGTLFLDEIGDMPLAMQIKLLRVLQERRIRPVGSNEEVPVDVRLVAATHRDLEQYVEDGRFREDLYYRINVIRIEVPPLRAREGDVVEFARHFAQQHARRMGRATPVLSRGLVEALERHKWPGNVRELANVMERAVALSESDRLEPHVLPSEIGGGVAPPAGTGPDLDRPLDLDEHLESERRRIMQAALDRCDGVQTRAAERLGMTFRSFRYFAKKYGLTGARGAAENAEEEGELVGDGAGRGGVPK